MQRTAVHVDDSNAPSNGQKPATFALIVKFAHRSGPGEVHEDQATLGVGQHKRQGHPPQEVGAVLPLFFAGEIYACVP